MSYLPREPFVDALVAWAISRAVMAMPRHFEEVAWLLRLNNKDAAAARTAIVAAAMRLRDEGSKIARQAAGWLLEALGDPEADSVAAQIRDGLVKEFGGEFVAAQPRHTFEPDCALVPGPAVTWTQDPKRAPDGKELFLYPREQGTHDVNLAIMLRKLAHTDPIHLRQLFADAANSAAGRNDSALEGLARRVSRFVYILSPEERAALRGAFEVRANTITSPEQADAFRSAARTIALWGLSAAEQLALITPHQPVTFDGIPYNILAPLTIADWPHTRASIDATTDIGSLRGWLTYLNYTSTPELLRDWPGLAAIVVHPESTVQRAALELAWSARNPSALEAFANSGWSAAGNMDRQMVAIGSGVLMFAKIDLGVPVSPDRMHPEISALAVSQRPSDPQLLDDFEAFFKAQMEWSVSPGSRTLPQYWRDHEDAIDALLRARGAPLLQWIVAWLDAHPKLSHAMLWDNFPIVSLCRVLLDQDPALGLQLWHMLLAMMSEGIVNRDDLHRMVLAANDAPDLLAARTSALLEFDKDIQIFEFSIVAQKHKRAAWLREEILRLVGQERPSARALGYQLASYLDQDAEADALWKAMAAPPAHARWLSDVYDAAKLSYDENTYAHAWHRIFIDAADPATAFAALELFFECADARAQLWAAAEIRAHRDTLGAEKRTHWWMNVARLNEAAKKSRDSKKDKLFGTPIMDQTQDPWL